MCIRDRLVAVGITVDGDLAGDFAQGTVTFYIVRVFARVRAQDGEGLINGEAVVAARGEDYVALPTVRELVNGSLDIVAISEDVAPCLLYTSRCV